ncbi:MAG: hypothetical protein VX338_02070 [Acidobacteriota bacterium]|nr:hypothetical protein [Acidobacteriota bacterium]
MSDESKSEKPASPPPSAGIRGVSPVPSASTPKPAPKPKVPPAAPTGPADPAPPEDVSEPGFLTQLRTAHGAAVEKVSYWVGDWSVIVSLSSLLDVATYLRDAPDAAFD